MEPEAISALKTLLELGWPAIVLLLYILEIREHRRRINDHIADLREIAGLRLEESYLRTPTPGRPTRRPPKPPTAPQISLN